jgi:succinylglutamic semialdehyde dehydrogenase
LFGPGSRLLRRGDYIWGSFVRPSRVDGYIVGVNPGDRNDVLGRFSFSSTSVDDAVAAAREAVKPWNRYSLEDRSQAIKHFAALIDESAEDLAILITRETGKPLWESREEVASSKRVVRLLADEGPRWLRPKVLREDAAWSDLRPHGAVGVITPFTFPLLIPTLHTAAALLAGNTVVYKPSKFTPGVGQAVAERIDRCRLPRGTFNLVQGSGAAVGHRIATHPGIDALLFSGSYATAQAIRRSTADRPELPALFQCGGKGSALVLPDADIERAAYDLSVSAFATTGQRHNSTARIFITRGVFDSFCERFAARAAEMVIGYGFDEGVFLGPLISDSHRSRYRRMGKDLVAEGHTPIVEANVATVERHRGYYVRPAIYWVAGGSAATAGGGPTGGGSTHTGGSNNQLIDEPVGPIVLVYCVEGLDEAVDLHNRTAFRLSTSVFTAPDGGDAPALAAAIDTGCLNINRGTIGSSLRLPAVGQGRSANGIPADIDLLRFLATPRATLVDRRPFDSSRWVPGTGHLPAPDGGHDGGEG